MFFVSLASFFSVFCGCLGTCVPCCGLTGSWAHFVVNWVYLVVAILGCVWRWSWSGLNCAGDVVLAHKELFYDIVKSWGPDVKDVDLNASDIVPPSAKW